jgi:hypothetical protein
MRRFFKAEDGVENTADRAAIDARKKYVGDMHHEA